MQFKGGLVNGVLATLYGAVSFWCLFFKSDMESHATMQKVCYVLAATGIVLGLYWLASKEVFGVPLLLVGLTHIGLARYAEHIPMDIGCAALASIVFIAGLMMLSTVRPAMRE
ncbi:MAG: hypothetical protein ACYC5A_10775 [Thermoleophilia bacterium]